jgi:polysaccharide export outer membrane protein
MNAQTSRFQIRNLPAGLRRLSHLAEMLLKYRACLALLPVLYALLTGCQTNPPSAPPPNPGAAGYSTNNLLEGDLVSITFQYSTNFNAEQRIALDGTLNLQGVGQVKAAGKSTLQLQNELLGLYKSQVKDDPITIKILAAESAVYVAGAVTRPGKIPLERPMTVLEAIMEAGGYDPYRADLSDILVLRVENGVQKAYRINLKRVLEGRDPVPFYLKPFDVVQVATKTFNF